MQTDQIQPVQNFPRPGCDQVDMIIWPGCELVILTNLMSFKMDNKIIYLKYIFQIINQICVH